MKKDDAFTGLEAGLVLIAFVVVASVFSYVVLSAGFFSVQKSQAVIYSAVEQGSSTIILGENIVGLKNTTTDGIDRIRFVVGSPYALIDIDMSKISVHAMTPEHLQRIDKASPFFDPAEPSPGTWRILSNTGGAGSVLESGSYATVMVNLPSDMHIMPGDNFRINILPPLGAPLSIDRKAPLSIKDTVSF